MCFSQGHDNVVAASRRSDDHQSDGNKLPTEGDASLSTTLSAFSSSFCRRLYVIINNLYAVQLKCEVNY